MYLNRQLLDFSVAACIVCEFLLIKDDLFFLPTPPCNLKGSCTSEQTRATEGDGEKETRSSY